MGHLFTFPMVRPLRIRGFSISEQLLVLSILAVMALTAIPCSYRAVTVICLQDKMDEIVEQQLKAIMISDYHSYENEVDEVSILFNRIGSVMHAETVTLREGKIIVSLGTGRVYAKP